MAEPQRHSDMLYALVLFPWMLPGAVGTKGPCLLCTELEVLEWAPAAFHTLSYSVNMLARCVQEREGLEIPLQMLGCISAPLYFRPWQEAAQLPWSRLSPAAHRTCSIFYQIAECCLNFKFPYATTCQGGKKEHLVNSFLWKCRLKRR